MSVGVCILFLLFLFVSSRNGVNVEVEVEVENDGSTVYLDTEEVFTPEEPPTPRYTHREANLRFPDVTRRMIVFDMVKLKNPHEKKMRVIVFSDDNLDTVTATVCLDHNLNTNLCAKLRGSVATAVTKYWSATNKSKADHHLFIGKQLFLTKGSCWGIVSAFYAALEMDTSINARTKANAGAMLFKRGCYYEAMTFMTLAHIDESALSLEGGPDDSILLQDASSYQVRAPYITRNRLKHDLDQLSYLLNHVLSEWDWRRDLLERVVESYSEILASVGDSVGEERDRRGRKRV